jgi:ketosteroid isomerase-like protein
MSQENLELVTRAMRAATTRPKPDFATMNAVFHPDHVLVPLTTLDTDEVRGARGYQAYQREQSGPSSRAGEAPMSWEVDLEGFVDVGPNKVLCVATLRARGSASGIDMDQRTWFVVTVRDGQVSRTEHYSDSTAALKAAGLPE